MKRILLFELTKSCRDVTHVVLTNVKCYTASLGSADDAAQVTIDVPRCEKRWNISFAVVALPTSSSPHLSGKSTLYISGHNHEQRRNGTRVEETEEEYVLYYVSLIVIATGEY